MAGIKLLVTSPQFSLDTYPTGDITPERVINIMVGDLQRIMLYPAKGYQILQEVPDDVLEAYNILVSAGYTEHMISE